jgi:hypothetical protein
LIPYLDQEFLEFGVAHHFDFECGVDQGDGNLGVLNVGIMTIYIYPAGRISARRQLIGTLLHEMCHALVEVKYYEAYGVRTPRVSICEALDSALRYNGHGYCWILPAVVVQEYTESLGVPLDLPARCTAAWNITVQQPDQFCCLAPEEPFQPEGP